MWPWSLWEGNKQIIIVLCNWANERCCRRTMKQMVQSGIVHLPRPIFWLPLFNCLAPNLLRQAPLQQPLAIVCCIAMQKDTLPPQGNLLSLIKAPSFPNPLPPVGALRALLGAPNAWAIRLRPPM